MLVVDQMPEGTLFRPLLVRLVEDNSWFGVEFWAAVVGAVVGGLIALGVQLLAARHARKLRAEEKTEHEKTHGHLALFKVLRMSSNLEHMRRHVSEGEEVRKRDELSHLWSAVLPLANVVDRVEFTPDELNVVSKLGDEDLLNNFLSLDQLHNAFIPLWDIYNRDRRSLLSKLTPENFEDGIGETFAESADVKKLKPAIYELEDLIKQIQALIEEAAAEAATVLESLVEALNERYSLKLKIEDKPK